ncbi:MAG: hypothetical protein V4760_14045 [Bdellovibrionota bacterium]
MTKLTTGIVFVVSTVVLSIAYTNCGAMGPEGGSSDNSSFSGMSCDEVRVAKYSGGYLPFLRSNCASCHVEGGSGLGTFASVDVPTSFAAFSAAGATKVGFMATNPQHKPPYTGIQNQPTIDRLSSAWQQSEKEFLECVSKAQNGGVDESLLTSPKGAPTIYGCTDVRNGAGEVTGANCPNATVTWDLNLASDLDVSMKRGLPTKISINVKLLTAVQDVMGVKKNIVKGYIFSNPVMQMTNANEQVLVEGLFFYINGQPITSQTTFTSVSRIVSGANPIPLYNAQANTLIAPVGSKDLFQVYFRRLVPTSISEDLPPPLTPILSIADAATTSNTHLQNRTADVFIMRDSGILRWCLSESPVKPASTEAMCVNSETGANIINGWSLVRPTSFTFSAGDGAKKLHLWVANEGLKINDTAAAYPVNLDTAAPAAASIGAITVGQTQVAPLSVSHPNESDVAGWCVYEQLYGAGAPTPKLDDECWKWTDNGAKPATVGFKGGGTRDVWVFVRDTAGNVSVASNKQQATNPNGAITFATLVARTGGPQNVMGNRCYQCHGDPTYPGFNKLNLFTYAKAIEAVDSGLLISRINNVISPMPNVNGGLMPQVERDLIRLWTMPEDGNAPIP